MPAGVVLGEMQTWQASSWDTFNRFFGKSTSVGSLCSDGPAKPRLRFPDEVSVRIATNFRTRNRVTVPVVTTVLRIPGMN